MTEQAERIYERLLVVRAQAGDEAAFAELVARYDERLRYFVRKLLGPGRSWSAGRSGDWADDVLQEVWLDVFRHLPRLADAGAFPAWVYRIARDRSYARLRKVRRHEQPLDEANLAGEEDDGGFDAEDAARIHAALDLLPPEQREVLVLRFVEEMSYEAIAGVTGLPVGTVRSRLHYAKRALRNILEREQP